MEAGKDFLSDKPGITTLEQLAEVRETIEKTNKIYAIMYSERLEVKAAVYAGELPVHQKGARVSEGDSDHQHRSRTRSISQGRRLGGRRDGSRQQRGSTTMFSTAAFCAILDRISWTSSCSIRDQSRLTW